MIKEELLLFVEIEDRAVTVFVARDLRNGVDKKKEAGEASSSAPQRDGQQSAGHSAVRARASPGLLAPAAHGHSRETF